MKLDSPWEGWRGVVLVIITYIYFLIFAQFAFLKYLARIGLEGHYLKAVMGAMAVGGILASLLAARISANGAAHRTLQLALSGCAFAASLVVLLRLNALESLLIALLIGSSLGLLTVTLVTHLRRWIGGSQSLMKVGLATGVGYLVCNFPPFFTASPQTQALASAALCLLGIGVADRMLGETNAKIPIDRSAQAPAFSLVLACFTALVWLDSAAFFIIQNTPALKAGTWEGTVHLWINGGLHLLAAVVSGWLLRWRGLGVTLTAAFVFMACACLLLLNPARAPFASGLYPVGVSLYSVALVAYPSFLAPVTGVAQRARHAGMIYAIAGWVGSALGIGMGQNLGHIPPAFVLVAAAPFPLTCCRHFLRERKRELSVTALLLVAAFSLEKTVAFYQKQHHQAAAGSVIELGHQTYIAEGCINCHSQYVRPNSPDVAMWGPSKPLDAIWNERPPLIGNRRQGPDLAEVGDRRSALWFKAHFMNPAAVSHASFMPSYAYLFHDGRGDALVAYLESLGSAQGRRLRLEISQQWDPSPAALEMAQDVNGAALFRDYCATCHLPGGSTRLAWDKNFRRLPPNLTTGALLFLPSSASPIRRWKRIAQIAKFGIPGTDMPGHEYLTDTQVVAIANWITASSKSASSP